MDAAQVVQIILVIVIVVLAILLVVLGIQVFFILKELRKTVAKTNRVLDDTEVITESIAEPISSLSNVGTTIRAATSLINMFLGKAETTVRKERREEEKNE